MKELKKSFFNDLRKSFFSILTVLVLFASLLIMTDAVDEDKFKVGYIAFIGIILFSGIMSLIYSINKLFRELDRTNKTNSALSMKTIAKEYPQFIGVVNRISAFLNDKKKPIILLNRLDKSIQKFKMDYEEIEKGYFIIISSDMYKYTEELNNLSKYKIESVNLLDLKVTLEENQIRKSIIDVSKKAISNNKQVEKIFILQREEDLIGYSQFFIQLFEIGVNVLVVNMNVVPPELLRDFLLFDSNMYLIKTNFEESSYNKVIESAEISFDKSKIKRYQTYYERLKGLSQKFRHDMISVDKFASTSVWANKDTREYYTGKPPELSLSHLIPTPNNILDIGCGAGRMFELFSKAKIEIVGIDRDPIAIGMCKIEKEIENLTLINDDFNAYDFQNTTFDSVIAYNSIYHSKKKELINTIDKVVQILNPKGYFMFTIKTTDGNEDALEGATEIEKNTWLGCNMPDYNNLHHFSSQEEIDLILSKFSQVKHQEEIPLIKRNGSIVQARGIYFILQK